MKQFLVFVVEPYRMMVEALQVRELLVRGGGGRISGGGHIAWRGRLVPEIGLAVLLGLSGELAACGVDLIYGEGDAGALVMLRADRVIGLRSVVPSDLLPLPLLAPELPKLFSGIVLDPADGKGILWLNARPEEFLAMERSRHRGFSPASA